MGCDCQSDLAEKVREQMNMEDRNREARSFLMVFFTLFAITIVGCFYCLSDPETCKWLRGSLPIPLDNRYANAAPILVTPPQEPTEVPVAVAEVTSDKDFKVKEPAPKPELTPEQKKAIDDQVKKSVADAVAAERRRAENRELEEKVLKYAVKSILSDDDDDGGFGGW